MEKFDFQNLGSKKIRFFLDQILFCKKSYEKSKISKGMIIYFVLRMFSASSFTTGGEPQGYSEKIH